MSWWDSPYTGLFAEFGPTEQRAHDPDVYVHAGLLVPLASGLPGNVGGGALTAEAAAGATVGEALERCGAAPLPGDEVLTARHDAWTSRDPAIAPGRFVLFRPDQYALEGFPFRPLTGDVPCRWLRFRRARDGRARWVPETFGHLACGDGEVFAPRTSTGLAAGRIGDPVVLRGLQEVVERDAAVGGWWGTYPLEEHDAAGVLASLGPELSARFRRPNLSWRFFRVQTPFAAHATWVSCQGEDREGLVFSTGSACRETRAASWLKSLCEAVQGRHWVRYLAARPRVAHTSPAPSTFEEHALYYTRAPEALAATAFARAHATPANADPSAADHDTLPALIERLGEDHPVLVRAMTPPLATRLPGDWRVVRVVVPGLHPLHGDHRLPHLGGPLGRGLDRARLVPHPFA